MRAVPAVPRRGRAPVPEVAVPPLPSIRPALRTRERPVTPLPRLRVPLSAYVVDCAVYVDGVRLPGRFTHDRAFAEVRRRGDGFVWIGLHEPDQEQITGIAEVFGLHELAVEDAVHAHQRPKLERYDETLFMVLKTVRYCGGETSARHGDHSGLHDVRLRLESDPEQLALGPAAVLHAVADHVVDAYLAVTAAIEDDIDELERDVFTPRSAPDSERIYAMKREVLELRR